MRTTFGRGGPRLAGVAVAAAMVLAAGCERSGRDALPPVTTPPGSVPATAPAAPVRADERRPLRSSFLVRAEQASAAAGKESCDRFAAAVRPIAVEAVGAYGFNGYGTGGILTTAAPMAGAARQEAASGAAAPAANAPKAGLDFSGTNVQEAGVDEPDVVKTDGRHLVTTADGRLRVLDVTGAPRLVGVLDLPAGAGNLLLVGDRAMVLSPGGVGGPLPFEGGGARVAAPEVRRPTTEVTVVDLADPAKPRIVRTHSIDGGYVDARLVGGVARIVTQSSPNIVFPQPVPGQQGADRAQATNADIVRKASPAAFLPKGASCADAYVPVEAAGAGTIAVQSLDPGADAPGPAVTVVADASTVYASAGRLFVATNRYGLGGPVRPASSSAPQVIEPGRTAIHAFDITDPAKARYAGSGDVPGRLLNQFSLSEDAGVLRVATTLDPTFTGDGTQGQGGSSQSRVSILRPAGDEWVETGAVDGLGKGERIYAVRFLGATGYVVTFRQVDPLYVLDLRDVRAPKVTGELKITGYSAYLHPAGERRLLGIGQEATDQGRRIGTQLSLFDVGDPAAPAKLAGAVLPSASSDAESNHHAFLFWPATGLVVAPVQSYAEGATRPFVGAVAFRVGDRTVTEAGRITHPGSTPIARSLVVGDRLLTLSSVGLAANDMKTLADGGFLPFR